MKLLKVFIIGAILLTGDLLLSQTLMCRTGHVHIESSNNVMDVVADNYQVGAKLNKSTGAVEFIGLTQSFSLESGALDRAFNSQHVNVTGYSKFTFKGQIDNETPIDYNTPGEYPFDVSGKLQLGGETRNTYASGIMKVNADGSVTAVAEYIMMIEQDNVDHINKILAERLSGYLSTQSLGISRKIEINTSFTFK